MTSQINLLARGAVALAQDAFGTEVTLKTLSTITYNSEGDEVKTFTESTITAILEPVAEMLMEGKPGRIVSGEFDVYLPVDISVDQGDEIVVDDVRYQVQDTLVGEASGGVYTHCVVKKIAHN